MGAYMYSPTALTLKDCINLDNFAQEKVSNNNDSKTTAAEVGAKRSFLR